MIVQGAPVFLALGAVIIAVAVAVFRASGSWKDRNREEVNREIEKYTK